MKYNIAVIGTFDLENFGDLMFPVILKKQLEKRISIEPLFLFSLNKCEMPLNPEKINVYSIDELENIHKQYGLNAIIYGGGDLVRFDNNIAPTDKYISNNTSFDLMVYSAVIADKYNIPYIWNCPGVPFEFQSDDKKVIKCVLDEFADYVSVRESRSADILKSCDCQCKINVSPDTVLSVSNLIDKDAEFDILKSEFSFLNDEYVVFQSMVNSLENFDETICNQLLRISDYVNKKIVFLPIGNVHKDDEHVKAMLNDFPSDKFVTFSRKLNIYEINCVLANSSAFIGTSLHGNIVSNSYKVPSLGLNICDFVKLKNYFKLIEREKYCIKDIETVFDTFVDMISNDKMQMIDDAINKVECHFDTISNIIKSKKHKSGNIRPLLLSCFERDRMARSNNVTVYFDCGEGFQTKNAVSYPMSGVKENFKFTLNVPENTKFVRIDPSDDAVCTVENLKISTGEKSFDYSGNYSNIVNDENGDILFFSYKDPQIIFEIHDEKSIDIEFTVTSLFVSKNFINDLHYIEELLYKFESIVLKNQNSVQEQKTVIENLNKEITYKNSTITNNQSVINSYIEQYNNLNRLYTDVINSFYWRLTAFPRKVTNKLKLLVSKNKSLMRVLVYLKGFLRGGFSEAKRKIDSYNSLVVVRTPLYISKQQRKYESKYNFEFKPVISILVPLYNTPKQFLEEMIDSVRKQTYSKWELCLADGSDGEHSYVGDYCCKLTKSDKRVKYLKLEENKGISENTNVCLSLSTGQYIALFDHDDLLHPSALFEYVKVINEEKADFIYCDESTFVKDGNNGFNIVLNHHKPEFSPDTLRSYNYICHFTCFSRKLYDIVGGFNKEYDGSQDYDLILRLTEKAEKIVRIPKLLYFWRSHEFSVASSVSAKPYVVNVAQMALSAHLKRVGLKGTVKNSYAPTTYKIEYEISGNPKISIIIPNKDHIDDLDKCLNSIYLKTTYNNYEIIVVENNSVENETFEYYKKIVECNKNTNVVYWDKKVFNYSEINNYGIKHASGEYILLLNNDIEIITPNWIEEMLMFAQRKDVGAVGAKLYYPDDTIQHAGVILGIGGVAGHAHKYFDRNAYGYVSRACISQNLTACTAACLLIRKDVLDEISGLDESFAVAFNDIDLCMRIRQKGYLIVFTPYAEMYHYESKSRGLEDSPEKIKRFNNEINKFQNKWAKELKQGDPYYNPNLTLDKEDFSPKY